MNPDASPSPALFFETINAYQRTAALKAAIDLNLFTSIGETPATAAEVAHRCQASARGTRILCDYLTIIGFLTKTEGRYALTPDAAMFLNRKSPAYAGGTAEFLLSPGIVGAFDDLAAVVRKGGTVLSEMGTTAPEHPEWLHFARSMGPLMVPAARALAELVPLEAGKHAKVLDIAASHGMYGIAVAQRNSEARLVALDWAPVLQVATENARAAGLGNRFDTIAGSAFEVDLGNDYDLVLVPNFLHHFPEPECVRFLRRVHAALRAGGRVAIVEFVPNPDR
ncbi:MAG TPA: class I SAM-dependent methyltransferase, partial [Chthoniobacteraceae bacterium]